MYCIFATSAELSFRLPVCCVSVCKAEREIENGRDGERRREKEKKRESVFVRVCVCVYVCVCVCTICN